MMVGTFTMPGGLEAVTLSDPPVWENTPGGIVATPLTVVALLMTPTGVVVAVTFVTAFPEAVARAALVKNDHDVVVVFTLVKAVPNVGATVVTAVPVCPLTPFTTLVDVVLRLAPVRNDPGVVCTPVTALANVGVTPVTTVVPGWPVMPLTALAKVGLTPVTHVSAEAEANSAALRLTRLTEQKRTTSHAPVPPSVHAAPKSQRLIPQRDISSNGGYEAPQRRFCWVL